MTSALTPGPKKVSYRRTRAGSAHTCVCVRACVCVCVRARARARVWVFACAAARPRPRVVPCVRACVHVCAGERRRGSFYCLNGTAAEELLLPKWRALCVGAWMLRAWLWMWW